MFSNHCLSAENLWRPSVLGYGNIACVTKAGRVMTMVYALFGIPLVLLSLNDLGKWIFKALLKLIDTVEGAKTWIHLQRRLRTSGSSNKNSTGNSIHSNVDYQTMEQKRSRLLKVHSANHLDEDLEMGLPPKSLHKTASEPTPGETKPQETTYSSDTLDKELVKSDTKIDIEEEEDGTSELIEDLKAEPKIPVSVALVRESTTRANSA